MKLLLIVLFVFFTFFTLMPLSALAGVQDSIIKVFTTSAPYDYDSPWQIKGIQRATGSGCVIAGDRILTNAHVISDAVHIEVQRYGIPEKYPAELIAVSHEADLALLKVEDGSFFKDVTPLQLGDLPELLDTVVVFGFPEGGEGLSVTKGIVSRIEVTEYVHSKLQLLGLQIDAAINSGNSGGPVIKEGKIVGVAMQAKTDAENIGYIIPPPIIGHFLNDLEDGTYDGYPTDGVFIQGIENQVFREALQLPDDQTGIYVAEVILGSSADGMIFPGDVILSVDEHNVANDGSIVMRPGLRLSSDYLVSQHQMGDSLSVNIWRNSTQQNLSVPLLSDLGSIQLVKRYEYDSRPQYFILSGLIFTPLTYNYLQTWGEDWLTEVPMSLLKYFFAQRTKIDEEVVIINGVLPNSSTSGYQDYTDTRIMSVNGQGFSSFVEFASLLDKALEEDQMIRLVTEDHAVMMISPQVHKAMEPQLLEQYGIDETKYINDRQRR